MVVGEGPPMTLPLKQDSSIFQVDHFPLTEVLSESRNFIVHYFSAENLKKLAYRKKKNRRMELGT